MVMFGADAAGLDSLARLLDQRARELERMHRLLGRQLHAAPWRGAGADRFRSKWSTVHGKQVTDAVAFLRQASKVMADNAHQQRQASAGGGGAMGSTAPPVDPVTKRRNDLAKKYDRTRQQIEDRKKHLRDEIARLKAVKGGGFMEGLGDANPFAKSKGEWRDDQIKKLQSELDALNGLKNLDDRQLLMVDGAPGDHRIIEVHGNLATAKKVVIHIPGITNDLGDYADGHSNAKALYGELRNEDVAVISFANYNIPEGIPQGMMATGAETGAVKLRAFVAELHRMGYSTEDISIVAHSYGSVVAGHAMQDGLDVGRVIALGSPGMGADSRAGLGSPHVDLWAASAPLNVTDGDQGMYVAAATAVAGPVVGAIFAGDPVSFTPMHGASPAADGFGANQFDVPDAYGHSAYFAPGSDSLDNIARLASGRQPR